MDKVAALTGMDGIYDLGALPNIYNMVTTLDNFLILLHLLNVGT